MRCYLLEFVEKQNSRSLFIEKYQRSSEKALSEIPIESLRKLIELLEKTREKDRQIFVCGNGGSASMSSHLAGELAKEPSDTDYNPFRIYSLTDNVAWISAIANDLDYSKIFVEQLKNLAREDDLLICFSCSGNSKNIIEAVEWANKTKLITVGITGGNGGRLNKLARLVVSVPSDFTPHVQEGHLQIQHLISYYFAETEFH